MSLITSRVIAMCRACIPRRAVIPTFGATGSFPTNVQFNSPASPQPATPSPLLAQLQALMSGLPTAHAGAPYGAPAQSTSAAAGGAAHTPVTEPAAGVAAPTTPTAEQPASGPAAPSSGAGQQASRSDIGAALAPATESAAVLQQQAAELLPTDRPSPASQLANKTAGPSQPILEATTASNNSAADELLQHATAAWSPVPGLSPAPEGSAPSNTSVTAVSVVPVEPRGSPAGNITVSAAPASELAPVATQAPAVEVAGLLTAPVVAVAAPAAAKLTSSGTNSTPPPTTSSSGSSRDPATAAAAGITAGSSSSSSKSTLFIAVGASAGAAAMAACAGFVYVTLRRRAAARRREDWADRRSLEMAFQVITGWMMDGAWLYSQATLLAVQPSTCVVCLRVGEVCCSTHG